MLSKRSLLFLLIIGEFGAVTILLHYNFMKELKHFKGSLQKQNGSGFPDSQEY